MSESRRNENSGRTLTIDNISIGIESNENEIPDGGFGWLVFLATLFFQTLIPSLIVFFGIMISTSRLETQNSGGGQPVPRFWDDKVMYVPLFFTISWILFDPTARRLISNSTWPRLVGTAGNCLTCAGMLFMWMGLAKTNGPPSTLLLIISGILTGTGASVLIAQCEILLAQYFRLKHKCLTYVTQAFIALSFIVVPAIVGHAVMNHSVHNVTIWYQAILLQGLVVNFVFKKPLYLKSKMRSYKYVSETNDDEEDIFSKNTELQVPNASRQQTNKPESSNPTTSTSNHTENNNNDSKEDPNKKNWVTFQDDSDDEAKTANNENETKYKFPKLQEAFAEDVDEVNQSRSRRESLEIPSPLFSDANSINVNNTYTLEDDEHIISPVPTVFAPTTYNNNANMLPKYWEIITKLTFYKSLLTVVTTKFSWFLFFSLFPSYLYLEINTLRFKHTSTLVGLISIGSLLFSAGMNLFELDKKKRPILLSILCWLGSFGYIILAEYGNEYFLLVGASEVALSITCLQFVGSPLLSLTKKGEASIEYTVLCFLTACCFLIFLCIDFTYRYCFWMMSVLHFATGLTWTANFIYKKIIDMITYR